MKFEELKTNGDINQDPNPPSFEELFGMSREQMEFECLPLWLQKIVDKAGYGSDVAEALIGMHQSETSSSVRAAIREIERDCLKVKKEKQLSGFTDHNATKAGDTDDLARKVQGFRRTGEYKGKVLKAIKVEACAKYDISEATYHRLLNRKLP